MKSLRSAACLLLLALLLTQLLSGCAPKAAPPVSQEKPDEDLLQIGMTFDSFVIERWARDQDIFVSTARDLGAQVYVQIANGDLQEQIDQINYFIEKKMDAIVIIATDCFALTQAVQAAKDAGIVVVAYDRMIMNSNIDLYVSFDNRMVGTMMAETLAESLPADSGVICITGPESDSNVADVWDGFQSSKNGLNVLYTSSAKGWLAETAYDSVQEAIDQGIEFSGVMCGNDDLATQAFQALSEHRLANSVCLVGQDADLAACQRIAEGTQAMTVYKPVEELARAAATYTVSLINNVALPVDKTIYNGYKEVPVHLVSPVKVTQENLEEVIINGGFHLAEEVYLNLK